MGRPLLASIPLAALTLTGPALAAEDICDLGGGAFDGSVPATSADLIFEPGAPQDQIGRAITTGDYNGDGDADIIESAIIDTDGDCKANQYDATNNSPDVDPAVLAQWCPNEGVCRDDPARRFGSRHNRPASRRWAAGAFPACAGWSSRFRS